MTSVRERAIARDGASRGRCALRHGRLPTRTEVTAPSSAPGRHAGRAAAERTLAAIREPGCSQRERQGEPMNDKNDKTRPMLEFATMRAQALEASRSDLEMLEAAGFRVWAAFERRVDELGREYMHAIGWRVTSGNRPAGYDAADFYALAVACASNLARERQRQSDRRAQEGLGA